MPQPRPDDPIRAVTNLTKSEISVSDGYAPQQIQEDRPLRFFVSYAHLDCDLKDNLLHRLMIRLKNHKTLRFEHWTDRDILVGTDWFQAIQQAMEACDFAILLLSPEFLSRDFIRDNELPWLYSNKSLVPVAVKPLPKGLDLRGLESKQIFFHNEKSYIDKTTARTKDQFVDALFETLCRRIESAPHIKYEPPPAASKRRRDLDHFRFSVSDVDLSTFAPTEGHETSLHKALEPGPAIDARLRKDAITFLSEWVEDKTGPPYAVLLGETGLGKTTTCKVFANRLFDRRETNPSTPLPIYFDLRHIGGRGKNLVLDEIVDLILKESWKGGAGQPRLTSTEIFDIIAADPTLVIWDGLDEVLVHLDENEGQRFTRQLFRILPPPADEGGLRHGRMLVTCRTHYFRTLRDQQTHLRGEDRDNIREQDYRAPFLLLPFTAVQIKVYLKATLPDRDPDGVMQVIAGVHNLTEMAERPYTLSLIVREFETIERWKAEGRQVTGVTLYRHLVRSWLERDAGKHQIQPDHKQLIMEHLAAALWQSGQRYWNVANLEDWLLDFFEANPKVNRHYRDKGLEQLKEDLRTATFLVRDGNDQFRFAHTSLQEFFLAGYVRRALIENQPERWAMSPVSYETLDFLGQWLLEDAGETRAAALGTIGRIRDTYTSMASENAFLYCRRASGRSYPVPPIEGFQLPGANLTGWEIEGKPDAPFRLDRINLQGARLWNTRWRNCSLSGAELNRADATGAEFLNCRMERSGFEDCILEATTFRDCDLRKSHFAGVSGCKSLWLHCDLTDAELPADALLALNRPDWQPPLPALRGYELWVASGHGRTVRGCAWSPDERRIVSASDDKTLRIWDAQSGQSLRILREHESKVLGCAWSPDGRRIVSASDDKTLRIWDAESGQSLRTLRGHSNAVRGCSWLPDSGRIVSASDDKTLRIWDAQSGQSLRTLRGHNGRIWGCAWSPDGRRIVSTSDDHTLRIWDAESGQSLRTLRGHGGEVWGCAWSPDGQQIASASDDKTLWIWDAQSGQSLQTLRGHDDGVWGCAWSPDGRRIASASDDKTLRIWDAQSGQSLRILSGHSNWLSGCVWSPSGGRIVSACSDKTLRIWDAESGQSLRTLSGHDYSVISCAWSPDGRRIASASADKMLQIWDAGSAESLRTLSGHHDSVMSCAWSPDGRLVASASADGTLRLWDAESGQSLRALSGHDKSVLGCAWSPDGRRIVSTSADKTLRIWDAESGQSLRALSGHESPVTGCAWSLDGRRIVSAAADKMLRIWDAESAESLRTLSGHHDSVMNCAWSPDGRLVASASADGTLRLWVAESGRELDRRIYLRISPDGPVWATTDHRSNRILACHAEAWRILGWCALTPGSMPAILPAETIGPLPVRGSHS